MDKTPRQKTDAPSAPADRGESRAVRSKPRLSPLADLVDAAIGPVLAAKGFAASDVVVGWPEIVGPRLAPHCEPLRMRWPRRPAGVIAEDTGEPGTLEVRVEGAFALELQHQAPVIVERVNTRYGWRCIGRIVLKQGPVGREKQRPSPPPPPDPASIAEADRLVGSVEDGDLRRALVDLGAAILAGRNRR